MTFEVKVYFKWFINWSFKKLVSLILLCFVFNLRKFLKLLVLHSSHLMNPCRFQQVTIKFIFQNPRQCNGILYLFSKGIKCGMMLHIRSFFWALTPPPLNPYYNILIDSRRGCCPRRNYFYWKRFYHLHSYLLIF